MRAGVFVLASLALVAGGSASGCRGCGSTHAHDSVDAEPASSSASASSARAGHLVRDDRGHLVPRRLPPVDDPADMPPAPTGEPGWDLDPRDPARDYADRYVRATKRYGDAIGCVSFETAGRRDGKAIVNVRDRVDARPASCAAPVAALDARPRDAFAIDVDRDRLEGVTSGNAVSATPRWPDGSDPAGPAGAPFDADAVPANLRDALYARKLTGVRAQFYGRGSYVVVTLAGWREPVAANASPAAMGPFSAEMCAATGGLPLGMFAGIDRATMLRITCGASPGARWDRL